ncbi:MAG: hypothetical protein R6U96_11995 [Promethearchaeia archaeon]
MRKKEYIALCFVFLVIFLKFNSNVNGLLLIDSSLTTDRDMYYLDETMKINASWNLRAEENEDCYFQIEINNSQDDILWRSTRYYEEGFIQKKCEVKVSDLNYTEFVNTDHVSINLICYESKGGGPFSSILVETKPIQLLKNISLLTTDKNRYYLNETMKINASWNLRAEENEDCYFQIEINNSQDDILWRSIRYYEEGFIQKECKVKVSGLNYTEFVNTDNISVNLILHEWIEANHITTLFKSQSIQLRKKNVPIQKTPTEIRKFNSLSFFSILILIFSLFIYLIFKNRKNPNEEDLLNITFRY